MVITWAFGHLFRLKSPEDYHSDMKKWELSALPIFFKDWGIKPDPDKHQQINLIKDFLKKADTVIHAGDPDDEGQLLIDEILDFFHYKGAVLRLSTNDLTASVIQKAYANMVDNSRMRPLGEAARARSIADFTVGIYYSRFFTLKNGGPVLSVGRVQSPTLGLVVARDALIDGHQKVFFYVGKIHTHIVPEAFSALTVQFPKGHPLLDTDGRVKDKAGLGKLMESLKGRDTDITVSKREFDEAPPLPFNLTKLQTAVFQRFKYNPDETLAITQSLREKHHLITYNRSTCQYLNDEQFDEAPKVVASTLGNLKANIPGLSLNRKSAAFSTKKVGGSAHTGIIPTETRADLSKLPEQERNVYRLIAAQYLAQFMPPCRKETTKAVAALPDRLTATASSTRILDKGYRMALPSKDINEEDDPTLCNVPEGLYKDRKIEDASVAEKETKPPARYNLASLGEDMTRISKYVTNPRIKQLLISKDDGKEGENGSIGTPATRDAIVKTLIKRGYIEEKNGKVFSTKLGRDFYAVLPDEVKNPDLTAEWWALGEDIKAGKAHPENLYQSVLKSVDELLKSGYKGGGLSVPGTQGGVVALCPLCGRDLRSGKYGFYCTGYKDEKKPCRFTFLATQYGKRLSDKQLLSLFEKRNVLVRGLKSKTGKSYDARLRWDGKISEKGYAVLEKPDFDNIPAKKQRKK